MILTIVKQYMSERGVELKDEISSKEDLMEAIKKLNTDDKKTLNGVVKKMDSAISKFEDTKAEKAKSALSFLENAFLIAATTMTVTDLVKFLDDKINNPSESIEDNTVIDRSGGNEKIKDNTVIDRKTSKETTNIVTPETNEGGEIPVTDKMKKSYEELMKELEER